MSNPTGYNRRTNMANIREERRALRAAIEYMLGFVGGERYVTTLERLDRRLVALLDPGPAASAPQCPPTPAMLREPQDPMAAIMHAMVTQGRKAPK